MSFVKFARDKGIIGQEAVLNELESYAHAYLYNNKLPHFAVFAPSGYGKTAIITAFIQYVTAMMYFIRLKEHGEEPKFIEYTDSLGIGSYVKRYYPNDKGEIEFSADVIVESEGFLGTKTKKKVGMNFIQFIDEVHRLKNPEQYFEKIASGDHLFIIATNEYDRLLNQVNTRFHHIHLDDYSKDELAEIMSNKFIESGHKMFTPKHCMQLVDFGRYVPRQTVNIAERLGYAIDNPKVKFDGWDSLFAYLTDTMKYFKGGLSNHDIKVLIALYMNKDENDTFQPMGINLLSQMTRIQRATLERDVEIFLMKQQFIIRSPKGRKIMPKGVEYIENYIDENKEYLESIL